MCAIEEKIDKLTELVNQTNLQEYRLKVVENDVKALKETVMRLDRLAGDKALKWLGVIASGILTVLIGFIAVKIGLK